MTKLKMQRSDRLKFKFKFKLKFKFNNLEFHPKNFKNCFDVPFHSKSLTTISGIITNTIKYLAKLSFLIKNA